MTTLATSFLIGSSLFLQVTRRFFFILAGNEDYHKISDGFEIRQDQTRDL